MRTFSTAQQDASTAVAVASVTSADMWHAHKRADHPAFHITSPCTTLKQRLEHTATTLHHEGLLTTDGQPASTQRARTAKENCLLPEKPSASILRDRWGSHRKVLQDVQALRIPELNEWRLTSELSTWEEQVVRRKLNFQL